MVEGKPGEHAENDDSGRVAADFIDLWQDQIGALADDHGLSEALESMLAMLNRVATSGRIGVESAHDGDEHSEPSSDGSDADNRPAGAAASGPAPGDDVELADELRRRIAECQSRIAALEP